MQIPALLSSFCLPGGGCRDPAGPRRAAGQHENSGSERQPEAPKLCQQPNPQEEETAGVWFLLFSKCVCVCVHARTLPHKTFFPYVFICHLPSLTLGLSLFILSVIFIYLGRPFIWIEKDKFGLKYVFLSMLQPQAQRQFLHSRPRERRGRLQRSAGEITRCHCTVYTTTSWSVKPTPVCK